LTWPIFAAGLIFATRILVLTTFALAALVAATHWAVRRGHLAAFGPLPRTVRRFGDPILKPLESRLVRWGRNPQDAPLWLVGIAVFGGILLLSLVNWGTGWIGQLLTLQQAGAASWVQFLITTVTQILMLAILVRVIGTWVGAGAYTPWMRPVYWLTEWLIAPIRRRLPTMGAFDLSPIVAYFVLLFLRALLYAVLV
jgi:YggT family protein